MSKIDLDPITSGYNLSKINANFQKVEDELNNKVLYRNSPAGEPNSMASNLDMNGKQIINVATGTSDVALVTKGYVDQGLALKFDKSGGPMSGSVDMRSNEITNVSRLSANTLEIGGVQVVPTDLVVDPYNGTREALRRSYAEAGYNMVAGSFEAGGTLVNANDVLLQERTGKAFSGPAGTVAAGTNPESGGFVDKSGGLLRHFTDAQYTTVAELATGRFQVGQYVRLTDRCSPVALVKSGGTQDGYGILDAGNGNTAEIQFDGSANAKWFGLKGDGVTSDSAAFEHMISLDLGDLFFPDGVYILDSVELLSCSNKIFRGSSMDAVKFRWGTKGPVIKSPENITFTDITFSPVKSDILFLEITASNYNRLFFEKCKFEGFGGATQNKAGSTCVVMYAGDSESEIFAAGDSKGSVFSKCVFEGDNRKTNFGVRLYTEFVTTQAATNSGNIISECTFNALNWNAVEVAGRNTQFNIVTNCIANLCGLTPFDIDKGAHDNIVSDCVINRLLGNIDPIVNPNTRITVCSVQGVAPDLYYAYNNVVRGIVANLKSSDLFAYGKPAACVGIAYAENNTVEDIKVYCDSVPMRVSDSSFALAVVAIETASGNNIRNIETKNASVGIFETAIKNNKMTSKDPNIFDNIINLGQLTGEVVAIHRGAATGAFSRNIVRNLNMKSSLSDSSLVSGPVRYALYIKADGSSSHFFKIEKSDITIPASSDSWLAYNAINNMSISDVDVNDNGAPLLETRFVASLGSTVPFVFGVSNINGNFGRSPINMSSCLANLNPTCNIVASLTDNGYGKSAGSILYASAAPSFPAATYYDSNLVINKLSKTAGGREGWVSISGVWREFGSIS